MANQRGIREGVVVGHFGELAISSDEKQKYVFSTDRDYEILYKIHQLEKQKLSPRDKKLIRFIRSQLELDWRSPVIKYLDSLLKKYN